jgi:hypothetical protein
VKEAKSTVIPNFVRAATPRGLRRLMLLTNKRLGAWHNFQIQFVNGAWYAWFHEEVTRSNVNDLVEDPRTGEVSE